MRELTWLTRRIEMQGVMPVTSSDTPRTRPPMNSSSSGIEGARPPCHARSTRWPTKPATSVPMTTMRVFSM